MFRSFLTILIVIIMVTAPAHTALAESRALFLPTITVPLTHAYGTVFGSAICRSGIVPSGAWLWLDRWFSVVNRDGSFVFVARSGVVAQIYYGQTAVSGVFTVPAGVINVGQVVLPC